MSNVHELSRNGAIQSDSIGVQKNQNETQAKRIEHAKHARAIAQQRDSSGSSGSFTIQTEVNFSFLHYKTGALPLSYRGCVCILDYC